MQPCGSEKIVDLSLLEQLRASIGARGETLVHCHGCFDIVHPGHIHHLRFAARQGDRLIVSVTPDRFVNKGPGRPMFTESLRADNLAALGFVDWVIINDAPTSSPLLERLRPDVYIKGAEYRENNDPRFHDERSIVERHGGRVVFSDDEVVFSSSTLIETIRAEVQQCEPETGLIALAASHDLSTNRLSQVIANARGKRVLILSESIIDVYAHCQLPEIAQEHPMLSLHPEREESFDGGGAVIAKHLSAMGLDVTLCTPIGDDEGTHAFTQRLSDAGIRVLPIACEQVLPIKLRYLVDGEKVMKIDSPVRYGLPINMAEEIVEQVKQAGGYDAMVIADFGLGLFKNQLASRVIHGVRDQIGLILGDVSGRRAQMSEMHGADVLCPCEVELRQMLDADAAPLHELAQRAFGLTRAETICVTRASDGLMMFDRAFGVVSMPALCDQPRDVLGCGDALLSAMTAAILGGADRVQSAYMGSIAAAIEGDTLGNLPVSADQLIERATQIGASLIGSEFPDSIGLQIEPRVPSVRILPGA